MPVKYLFLLFAFAGNVSTLFSQHIDEGLYNDWAYGPNGVYGKLPLSKVAERKYYNIQKKDNQTVVVRQFNPSGIPVNTATVTFVKGVLSRVAETNQWEEIYDYRNFTPTGKNEFIVTELSRGVNEFLPCKYAKYIYNDQLLTEIQYYSFADSLLENKNGFAIVRYQRYDDKIRFAGIKEMSFYDAQNRPVVSKAAECHAVVNEYDEHDNKLSESYLDIHDEPTTIQMSNRAAIRYAYDEQNNQVKYECHGLDGNITENISGIAIAETEFSHGYPSKVVRFDARHVVTRASAAGDSIAIIKYQYDSNGNRTQEAFYDEGEIPILDHGGVHKVINSYSPANMLVQTSFIDDLQKPCDNRDGIHSFIYGRDTIGRIIQESTCDIEGVPVKRFSEKVFLLKYRYDEYGRRISVSYWKDSVTRMRHWLGNYEEITKFDADGRPVEYITLDQDGKPYKGTDGASTHRLVYRADGRLDQREFLDGDTLISRKRGVTKDYSILRYSYDDNGRVHELTFFDKDDQPVNATIWFDTPFPAHRIVFQYKGSRIVQQWFYGMGADQPYRVIDCLKSDFIAVNGISTGRKNVN